MKKQFTTLNRLILSSTRQLHQLFLFLYCALVFWVSHQPSVPVPHLLPHFDKLIHAATYCVMSYLAWVCFSHYSTRPFYRTLFFCMLFGATDEWHQSFIIGRLADPYDWAADIFGAAIAAFYLRLQKNTP
ncbi:MAG TPA: VanZ family protein [Methylococcaceae bacterium]|nr:VanZ family protein [Methylococcaceae bacterium]